MYYHPTCAKSRAVRVLLTDAGAEFKLVNCEYWRHPPELLKITPLAKLPILIHNQQIMDEINLIYTHLQQEYPAYFGRHDRSHQQNELKWLNLALYQFTYDVISVIVNEKAIRFYLRQGSPDSYMLRAARNNLRCYLAIFNDQLSKTRWIAGETLSGADLALAGAISLLDYFGEIKWEDNHLKNWYMVVKSRPSFKAILREEILGFPPAAHYALLDF